MIIVCEPQIRGFGHEKVNSGFLLGLSLAFPAEKIMLYAHSSHIEAIVKIIDIDNLVLDIEYIPIKFNTSNSLISYISYYFLFIRLLPQVIKENEDKLFLLSFSSKILDVLKRLKRKKKFSSLKFTLVTHGAYEEIAVKTPAEKFDGLSFFKKGVFILKYFWRVFYLFDMFFYEKKSLLKEASPDFKYIFLSSHIRENSKDFIDLQKIDNYIIPLPTVFKNFPRAPKNQFIKFAIFGRGDYEMLNKIATELETREIYNNYEIRIIGKDYQGLEKFSKITCSSPRVKLLRTEMERQVADIDVLLIIYDKSKYRLSCSGSVYESMSYAKPIFHFESDCLKNYNTQELPIGISCNSISEFADIMATYINNYDIYSEELNQYRNNILKVRSQLTIESSVSELRKSFSW